MTSPAWSLITDCPAASSEVVNADIPATVIGNPPSFTFTDSPVTAFVVASETVKS
jgi:hypothetical protein